MSTFEKSIAGFVVVMLLLLGGLKLYWREYWKTYEAGAVRGATFATRYQECYGQRPSEAIIRNLSHFINDPYKERCAWLPAIDKHISADVELKGTLFMPLGDDMVCSKDGGKTWYTAKNGICYALEPHPAEREKPVR